jgi:hypothetical protein
MSNIAERFRNPAKSNPAAAPASSGNTLTKQSDAPATQQAYAVIYGTLVRQAAVMSYIDIFRLLACLRLLCVPAVFLFKRVKDAGPAMH